MTAVFHTKSTDFMNSASEKILNVSFLIGSNGIRTKELSEENKRKQVEENGEQLGQDHEGMPRADGERHHRQLCEDERRVTDRHNMDELVFKEQEGSKHDDTTLVHSGG